MDRRSKFDTYLPPSWMLTVRQFDAEVNDFTHKVLADASRDKFLKQFSAADEAQTEKVSTIINTFTVILPY